MLTNEEAEQQTQLFMDYMSPVTGLFKDLEDEIISIVTNSWSNVVDVMIPTQQ